MGIEWKCVCKDCTKEFAYSNTRFEAGKARGWSRPERCDNCRAQHARENQSIGQPYHKIQALRPITNPRALISDLGRFEREERKHLPVVKTRPPIDENKFGIKDDRVVEMFHFFRHDPGLQVCVVVGPTGSGKSTYFPYCLVEPPRTYKDESGAIRDDYWTVPIETDDELMAAKAHVNYTELVCGLYRHYQHPPNDPRARQHRVADIDERMFHRYGQIVVTQPRIQATRNIPGYIAKAMLASSVGAGFDIGFRHSGAPNSDWNSKLAFVTDGTLITWIAKGELDKINTIMIDEAHERSLNIDIIIGLLTQVLPRYPRLRLIIASATIAADKFINHFNKHLPTRYDAAGNALPNCRIMEFEGKSFKVTSHFRREDDGTLEYSRIDLPPGADGEPRIEGKCANPNEIHNEVAKQTIEILKAMYRANGHEGYLTDHNGDKIDITERRGDVLGFLHGEQPIQNCCKLVLELAATELGKAVTVEALPLYTTLPQKQQDDALLEPPTSPHGRLAVRILGLLEEMALGRKVRGDVLAILNNAGQIHNLAEDLTKRVASESWTEKSGEFESERPNPLGEFRQQVKFFPWFTLETSVQLFGTESQRSKMTIDPPAGNCVRVVISSDRHRSQLNADEFPHVFEDEPEKRRVVVSTNVAETSLTIHGILHVVDSGLINQNKWDPATQTSAISPILQSRAGCKQRWGRAGRLQAGDAWLLYTETQFGKEKGKDDANPARCFDFYSKPEISRSPLEQVLLTAKQAGVQSLAPASFPWLDEPDSQELARAKRSLEQKGALDADGDLTDHGLELGRMRLDANVANLMIVADRFACAVEMAVLLAVLAEGGIKKLFEKDKRWDESTLQAVRKRQWSLLSGCRDDLDAATKVMACWDQVNQASHTLMDLAEWLNVWRRTAQELMQKPGGKSRNNQSSGNGHSHQVQSPADLARIIATSLDESAIRAAAWQLLRNVADANRSDLHRLIEKGLRLRQEWKRLEGAWLAAIGNWAWDIQWREGVLHPARFLLVKDDLVMFANSPKLLANRGSLRDLLVESASSESEACVDAFPERLEKARQEKMGLLDCVENLARTLGEELRPLPAFAERVQAINALLNPKVLRSPNALAHFLFGLKEGPRNVIAEILKRLPNAAANAWATSNYLLPKTLDAAAAARKDLLEPLEAHKKGEEKRPLELGRNDRLRAIFTHCLPENTYSIDGKGTAIPLMPPMAADPVAATTQASVPLQIEIDGDSLNAATPPPLFVCVERRAGKAPTEGGTAKLFASFIVALPTAWRAVIGDAKKPFHKLGTIGLSKFIAENCGSDAKAGERLLLDQGFPLGARCRCKITGAPNSDGSQPCTIEPPAETLPRLVLRYKRADESAKMAGEADEGIEEIVATRRRAPADFGIPLKDRKSTRGQDVMDTAEGKSRVDSREWEKLFTNESESHELFSQADDEANDKASIYTGSREPDPGWAPHTRPGVVTADKLLSIGDVVQAEVAEPAFDVNGQLGPRLVAPPPGEQVGALAKQLDHAQIGTMFTLIARRVETLPFDGGTVLIAAESNTGAEISFGPRDLSFSNCSLVPMFIFKRLGKGAEFKATLVQIDDEAGRIRMATHSDFDLLFTNDEDRRRPGVRPVRVAQHNPWGPFVLLADPLPTKGSAFLAMAKLGAGELAVKKIGDYADVHLTFRNKTTESWPAGVRPPTDFLDSSASNPDGIGQNSITHFGPMLWSDVQRWMAEVGNDRSARAALYSLYVRTHEFQGADSVLLEEMEKLVGTVCEARITKKAIPGLELTIGQQPPYSQQQPALRAWLWDREWSWRDGETIADGKVGQTIPVRVLEVDPDRVRLTVSRRQVEPFPYTSDRIGTRVMCTVTYVETKGVELSTEDGLRAWMYTSQFASLPGDGAALEDGAQFDALVTGIDSHPRNPKFNVSRSALVLQRVREFVGTRPIIATVVEVKDRGLTVELAPGLVAWLPRFEVTWRRDQIDLALLFKPQQSIEVVLLPPDGDSKNELRVSSKQVAAQSLLVTGKRGYFFKNKWPKLNGARANLEARTGRGSHIDVDGEYLHVKADDRASLSVLVNELATIAYTDSCNLVASGPKPAEAVAYPWTSGRIPTAPTSSVPKPLAAHPKSFWGGIMGFFRWLFGR